MSNFVQSSKLLVKRAKSNPKENTEKGDFGTEGYSQN